MECVIAPGEENNGHKKLASSAWHKDWFVHSSLLNQCIPDVNADNGREIQNGPDADHDSDNARQPVIDHIEALLPSNIVRYRNPVNGL